MDNYIIYCTPEQVKKALELGAKIKFTPSSYYPYGEPNLINPTAEMMTGWLETQGLFISIDKSDGGHIFYKIRKGNKYICEWNSFSSRPEATLAAIDAALEYLEGQKNKH